MGADGGFFVDLSDRARIRISGADATGFLQNQVTGDVSVAARGLAQLTALALPNGRVLAVFRVQLDDDGWLLSCRSDAAGALLERLMLMKLRARIEIEDVTRDTGQLGVVGDDAEALRRELADACGAFPACLVTRHAETVAGPRVLISAPASSLAALRERLARRFRAEECLAWRRIEILSGVPDLPGALSGRFLPQFLGLERLGGLSFEKGCYPGQEVIARTHYLGKTVRRLVAAETTAPLPAPGTAIRTGEGRDGGTVVEAVPKPEGGALVQAVVPVELLESGTELGLAVGDGGTPPSLRVLALRD